MLGPYGYLLIALLSFAGMGVVHKLGERTSCNPLMVALITMGTAGAASLARAWVERPASGLAIPAGVALLAVPFGVSAAVAIWLFQRGLQYGHIAMSWLLINLSAAVPTGLSVLFYHESLSRRKLLALAMIAASLVLLWRDRRAAGRAVPEMQPGPEVAATAAE